MKKRVAKQVSSRSMDNSFGIASVALGITGLFSSGGLILAIIALIFAKKQEKISSNKWSNAGKILGIIGIILGIILIISLVIKAKQNPELFTQFLQQNYGY